MKLQKVKSCTGNFWLSLLLVSSHPSLHGIQWSSESTDWMSRRSIPPKYHGVRVPLLSFIVGSFKWKLCGSNSISPPIYLTRMLWKRPFLTLSVVLNHPVVLCGSVRGNVMRVGGGGRRGLGNRKRRSCWGRKRKNVCFVNVKIISVTNRETTINLGETKKEQAILWEANIRVHKPGHLGEWTDHHWAEAGCVSCRLQLICNKLYKDFIYFKFYIMMGKFRTKTIIEPPSTQRGLRHLTSPPRG